MNSSSLRVLLTGRTGSLVVAIVVTGLLVFMAWLFLGLGVYTLRSEVSVAGAELRYPDNLTLIVDSCQKAPGVSILRETDIDVQVKVVASSEPFLRGGDDCQDTVGVQLREPLGDRVVLDMHTGQLVRVTEVR